MKRTFLYLLLVVTTAASLAFILYPQIVALLTGPAKPDEPELWQKEDVHPSLPEGPINTIRPAQSGDEIPTVRTGEVVLPILLYHHIREYSHPEDLIGTRLSVSPGSFANQLDEISRLGYHPITFKDLMTGPLPEKPIILTFDDGYRDFYENGFPELVRRKMKGVAFIVTKYIGARNFLTKEELQEMARNGIEIGSHTISHPSLKTLLPEKQRTEIEESKKALENILGEPVLSFSYPYGDYDLFTVRCVEEAGYRYAVTSTPGEAVTDSPFLLKRVRVPDAIQIEVLIKRIHAMAAH